MATLKRSQSEVSERQLSTSSVDVRALRDKYSSALGSISCRHAPCGTHGNLVAEWYPYRPFGVREKRKEYGSGSDKSGSVDQIEAGKGCEGHRYECDVLGSESCTHRGLQDG